MVTGHSGKVLTLHGLQATERFQSRAISRCQPIGNLCNLTPNSTLGSTLEGLWWRAHYTLDHWFILTLAMAIRAEASVQLEALGG
jgi:hypothetical protein